MGLLHPNQTEKLIRCCCADEWVYHVGVWCQSHQLHSMSEFVRYYILQEDRVCFLCVTKGHKAKWNVLLHFSLENINTYFCSSNLAPLRVCCMCAVCEPSLRLYHKTDTGQITEMPIWPSLYENLCCDSQNQSLCLSVSLYRLKKIISPLRLRSSSCLMLLWGSFTVYYGEPKRREGWTWNNVFKRWFELIQ